MVVVTVALDRLAASFANDALERRHRLLLWGLGTGHMKNFLLHNCPVKIVHAIVERDLREWQPQADPVSGKMIDVIEVNSTHRQIAKLIERCGWLDV